MRKKVAEHGVRSESVRDIATSRQQYSMRAPWDKMIIRQTTTIAA